jgi:hypothetical protein
MRSSITVRDMGQILGSEAADDESIERLQQYFLETKAWRDLKGDSELSRFRILVGGKGTGKSALLRMSEAHEQANDRLAIRIRPSSLDIESVAIGEHGVLTKEVRRKLDENIQLQAEAELFGALQESRPSISKGIRLAEALAQAVSRIRESVDLDSSKAAIVDHFVQSRQMVMLVDDLDRWGTPDEAVRRTSALIDAIREILRANPEFRCRIALRADLWDRLRSFDSNSDHYEANVSRVSWTSHEIYVLLVKRVCSFQGQKVDYESLLKNRQQNLTTYLASIIEPRFDGQGKWKNKPMHNVLISNIRRRPRDLIKLLRLAGENASERGSSVIQTRDLEVAFPEFSQGRIQDIVSEYGSELHGLEALLYAMKPSKRERRTSDSYLLPTDEMYRRLDSALQQAPATFEDGTPATARALLPFLYKIDFLQARRDVGDEVERVDYEMNPKITPETLDLGYMWEIHLAFRWALQFDDPSHIYRFAALSS